jgi:hypothetical protein
VTDLALPPGTEDKCNHEEVQARVKIPLNQYKCGCGETLYLIILQAVLTDKVGLDKYHQDQAQKQAAVNRKKLGLVLPDEARQMKKKQEGRKR